MKRDLRIFIRVTSEERDAIVRRAAQHGYKFSGFIREAAVLGRVQPVLSINLQQWAKLTGLATNLNQLTRHCNSGVLPADALQTIEAVRQQVEKIRDDLITKRGLQP